MVVMTKEYKEKLKEARVIIEDYLYADADKELCSTVEYNEDDDKDIHRLAYVYEDWL